MSARDEQPIHSFFATPANPGPLLLRLTLAWVFLYHGLQKTLGWFDGVGWARTVEVWTAMDGMSLPYAMAVFALVAELIIAVALFLGFFTRLAALGAVVLTAGSIYFSLPQASTFGDIELPVLQLTAALGLVFLGGGILSIDRGVSTYLLPSIG